mgnify:CR=1 FL=1
MKDRRDFQILDGFRQSSGKRSAQESALAREASTGSDDALRILLLGQVEDNLALALTASEQRLSALLHDRSRIGQELHDSVLQALHAIGASLAQSSQSHRDTPPDGSPSRHQTANQLQKLIHDIRRMISGVESDMVEPFNLISELRLLAHTCEQMCGFQVRVSVAPAAEAVLTAEEAYELAAIAREALNNSVRHARATHIAIALLRVGSRVRLRVRDNGSGFDVTQGQAKGVGFAHMEHRVRKIGGRLNIQSTARRGTCITADVYLEPILTMI